MAGAYVLKSGLNVSRAAILIKKILQSSFIRFCIVGVSNTTIDFVGFCFFYYVLGLDLVVSNILSFIPAVTNSYLLNKYWSFGHVNSGRRSAGEYSVFILIALCGLGINTFVLWMAEEHMHVLLAKVAATCVSLFWNFACYRVLFLRKKKPEQI